ncbi:hypothetical protein H0H87_008378 [Tephrocybe sp. NHM501043]|nr:hypothetical protein H0H87_008378 [Tephrocybe sp. NHM501043]
MDEDPSSPIIMVSKTSKESPLFDPAPTAIKEMVNAWNSVANEAVTTIIKMDKKWEHDNDRKQSNKILPPKHICITQDQQIAEQEELKGDKCTFKLELSHYKGSIKHIAKKFKWEQMCWDGLAIVVQVSDLELDCLKAEHQAAQATWMKENRDFKKQLTAADNKVNNSNEVILSLMTKLTTQLDSFKKE